MMHSKDDGEMIGLKDLFFGFLKQWRWIIFTATILGVLLGGLRVVERLKFRDSVAFSEQSNIFYENAKLQYDREKGIYEEELKALSNQVAEVNNYYENAAILEIDPYKKNMASADVFISVAYHDRNHIQSLLDASISYFNSGRAANDISELSEMRESYIQDLITVNVLDGSKKDSFSKAIEEELEGAPLTLGFHVSVIGASEEYAVSLLEKMLNNYKNNFSQEMAVQISPHTVSVIEQGVLTQWDDGLNQMKNDILNLRYNLQKEIKTREDLLLGLEEPKLEGYPNNIVIVSGFKYALLGVFLGGLIGICIAFIISYYNDNLLLIQEQKKVSDKTILIVPTKKHRGLAKRIDYILNQWQYKEECVSENVATSVIETMIRKQSSVKTIGIVTDMDKDTNDFFQDHLKKSFPQSDILLLPDILNLDKSFDESDKCDWIMLLEDANKASRKRVMKKEQLLLRKNKKISVCLILY